MAVGEAGLLVGGSFEALGGIACDNLAFYDGTSWSTLEIPNITIGSTTVHTVGWIGPDPVIQTSVSSDITDWYFMIWTGSGWSGPAFEQQEPFNAFRSVGERYYGITTSYAYDLSSPLIPTVIGSANGGGIVDAVDWHDQLLVHGAFTGIDGVAAAGLATYDGELWSSPVTGLTGAVTAATVQDGALIVAGSLSLNGDDPHSRIVSTDGATHIVLADNYDDSVSALAVYRGLLYAAGRFATIGGIYANNIACWTGDGWSPLDSGIDRSHYSRVDDLAVHAGRLWVSGSFYAAGSHPAQNICTWYQPAVPIFLQEMTATREADGVHVSWTVSGEGGEFRLVRGGDGQGTCVVFQAQVDHQTTLYRDTTAPLAACRYTLYTSPSEGVETRLAEVEVPDGVPTTLRLSEPAPNPFNPATQIRFDLARPGRAVVTVHDLLGRRVVTLLDEVRGGGMHEITWYGCDHEGRPVASGTYLVRLFTNDESRSVKAVLTR
jgi:hypothetical protein